MKRPNNLVTLLMLMVLTACARPPDLIGVDNPEIPAASVAEASRHKVFLATTRQASESTDVFYSTERAPALGLASVEVSIPPNHVTGELERPTRLPPDPSKEFAIVEPERYGSEAAFIASVNAELAKRPRGQRDILFFVHGYNNTTSDALLRLAQFVEDSGFDGVPVLFDWASAAQLSRYVYDLNSALIARPALIEAGEVLNRTNVEGFSVFAHSMGGLLVMEAMRDQALRNRLNDTGKLQHIVLASPDIDLDLFRTQLSEIDTELDAFFVLLSRDDSALRTSRRIAGGVARVGAADANALAKLGVIAIDLSEIDDSASGSHSKFAGSPEIVRLLGNGLNTAETFDRGTSFNRLDEVLADIPIKVVVE